jgi:glyoxylase-like metal-dependent hydrolase (beta-lactamase superfamily II)
MSLTHEVVEGVRRVTFALSLGIDHVHCYFLRGSDGAWTLVDTGLGVADAEQRWTPVLVELGGRVERIVITHFHPDHVGGAADVAALTGAPVFQGRDDYVQCVRTWADNPQHGLLSEFMRAHGVPERELSRIEHESAALREQVRFARDPHLLDPADRIDGWEVHRLRGHADGHICLLRDGVLVAGDAILGDITPTVGLYPRCRPDPLADYLESLRRGGAGAPRASRLRREGRGARAGRPNRLREAVAAINEHEGARCVSSAVQVPLVS